MSFRAAGVSALRFSVPPCRAFDQEHVDALNDRRIGKQRIASEDGVDVGWAAGSSVLDVDFNLEKNVIGETLQFDLRLTKDVLPGDLMKAYYEAEILAMEKGGQQVGRARRRQCKVVAKERLQEEARDGRFAKHRLFPCLWDRQTSKVYFGTKSTSEVHRFASIFEKTFGVELQFDSAGLRADALVREDTCPSAFMPGISPCDIAWCPDETSRDWLGNEFLLWLWYWTEVESDTIHLSDETEVTVMFHKSLVVDCPRAQTGADKFMHEGPTRLPEARRAIQSGKMPRKAEFIMVRQDTQYEFNFSAETFAIGSAKLVIEEDVTGHQAKLERRAELWRELNTTLDLLYDAFLSRRCTPRWEDELRGMTGWLKREERR